MSEAGEERERGGRRQDDLHSRMRREKVATHELFRRENTKLNGADPAQLCGRDLELEHSDARGLTERLKTSLTNEGGKTEKSRERPESLCSE